MASDRWRRFRRWARRRRTPLVIGGIALVLAILAAFLIYQAATDDVVGSPDGDGGNPFAAPSSTPGAPTLGPEDLLNGDPASFGLPSGGFSAGCDIGQFTLSYTSDAPISIGGYLTSAGDMDYFPVASSGSVSTEQCPTNPSALILIQAGPAASTITCTATLNGRAVETRTAPGSYGIVYCYA